MSHILDETTTKLHTDNAGNIWYSRGIAPPQNSEQTLAEFLLSPVVSGMGLQFRLFGTIENAELISSLYLRKNRGEVRCVEVAAPHFLTPVERAAPVAALLKMRSISVPATAGGWHAISFSDYSTYALAARMYRNRFVFDDMAGNYLKIHPAYKALTFIPNFDPAAAAQLFVTITDPRWFVDARAPTRNLKIALYLGLTPTIQKRVSDPDSIITTRRELRCASVLGCWKTVDAGTVDMAAPENFLYRIWRFNGSGYKGDLRASQAFITYMQQNWLSAIERRTGAKDGLFAPDLFFKAPEEVAAYTEHMQPKK